MNTTLHLRRTCFLVLGAHRSGTSALTRVLSLLGAELPRNLLGVTPGNEAGHWEPERLLELNDRMLREAGSRWDDWRVFDPKAIEPTRLDFYKQEIARLIQEEYLEHPLFVLKDPRICRFVPLYEEILTSIGIDLRFVLPHRNPLGVVASLGVRDAMSEGFASLLWLRHAIDAEAATRGKPRAFLSYEGLLDDWRTTMVSVTTSLGIELPVTFDAAAAEIERHIAPTLRHHAPTMEDLTIPGHATAWVRDCYAALRSLEGAGPEDDAALKQLSRVKSEVDAVSAIYGEATFPELAARERRIADLEVRLAELTDQHEAAPANSATMTAGLEERIAALGIQAANLHSQLVDRNATISHLSAATDSLASQLTRREEALRVAGERLREQEAALSSMRDTVADRDRELERLHAAQGLAERNYEALARDRHLARGEEKRLHDVLDEMYASTSWRVSSPIRSAGYLLRAIPKLPSSARRAVVYRAYRTWHSLPLAAPAKRRLKDAVFKSLPFLFRKTGAYRAWQEFRREAPEVGAVDWQPKPAAYVPLLDAPPLENKPVRTVAFYLPQFHAIAENDEWWGKGFTEWTNVRPAEPQFQGHYQPHVPGELGYYDLLDPRVQRRQIELAKLYGIEGFCFYFYWFGGRRLLEKPVENWLNDKSLDLPFCLCWANENWSRRWDGLDREILIAQDYSADDDIAFITAVAPYLRDARYIRIDGRPLILVYRPSLLPSATATAQRWRDWCREHGIGEIYLAYTQSFEAVDPGIYGFDAAVEFPPNNSSPPDVTETVTPLREDFGSTVYDWQVFVRRSESYEQPAYKLFRSVCPGWDNTARRKSGGTVFVNNTPELYRRWFANAVAETTRRLTNPDERLLFVNAWNEWAEGAHLEPDAQYGYAWLQATRDALTGTAASSDAEDPGDAKVAIVVHAFYPDVFEEILAKVKKLPPHHKLFVTTTNEAAGPVAQALADCGRESTLRILPNRGRDVLPFIKILPEVKSEGFRYLVKVHTKKSPHRADGAVWRRELYEQLLDQEGLDRALDALKHDQFLGMIGPTRHYVPMSTYIGSNGSRINEIGHRLGLSTSQIRSGGFFAGTMFIARTAALDPLVALGFRDDDFEAEAGQIDGTFAHALERAIALSVASTGMRVAGHGDLWSPLATNARYGYA